ncbi:MULTISPECIES: alpha/beta fold hydrolase [Pseudoalteromonas]|uniref:Esterase n=1 Tax=Pseudoalteromonas amylolytica TaxID=1859457 RepID=A0A1S1MQ65_9GAMM|nr:MULTISPECIES: alpha/beta hydrolase [Pseudoalteromonas]OHU84282.1 esterase [Pseudoalteromonas sp. JW3]OHU87178.1 esterase [Pseudoalteromonas amylolytica]
MSSKIYFSDKSGAKPFSYYGVKALSSTVARIAPAVGKKFARRLLLTPVRHQSKASKPLEMSSYTINTQFEALHVYELGHGPVVLFTHGWSGSASQFYPLMEKVASLGFKAVAFDHYAHGMSAGKEANLPLFIRAIDAVQKHLNEGIHAAISHSMGCVAALNTINPLLHVLIAPPFDFYNGFEQRILSTGISKTLFKSVIHSVEQQHQMRFDNLLPELHLAKHDKVLIIHDVQDKFAQHDNSQAVVKQYPHVELISTQGLGHGRIINDDHTWQSVQTQLQKLQAQ